MMPPRSIFAEKLRAFTDLAFVDAAAFAHRGQWREWFESRMGGTFDGRIILEIGCADAAFLARIATKHPTSAFIGLDWKYKALHDGAQRVADAGLRNVALLRGRGQDVSTLFGPAEIDEVWVFHPDPCAREAELKNRLIAEPFLTEVHAVLRGCGSAVTLKTDHPGYYQWVLSLFGLPEPEWFAAASGSATQSSSRTSPRPPRRRARDLMRANDIPAANPAIMKRFHVAVHSPDFWNDAAAQAQASTCYFAGERTAFESRFVAKHFPIYYVEMAKVLPERTKFSIVR
jgi:tRNA G46 methylase TrmB